MDPGVSPPKSMLPHLNSTHHRRAVVKWHESDDKDNRHCAGKVVFSATDRLRPIQASCALRRLSVCGDSVLRACNVTACRMVLVLRMDLAFTSPNEAARELEHWTRLRENAFVLRRRCSGGHPGSHQRTRSRAFDFICHHAPQGIQDANRTFKPCLPGLYTVDDHLALMPASFLPKFFLPLFPPIAAEDRTCPATVRWPEGRLTDALLASGARIRELHGVASCLSSNGTTGSFPCCKSAVDFGADADERHRVAQKAELQLDTAGHTA